MTNDISTTYPLVITPKFFLFFYFLFLFVHTLHIGDNKTLLFGYIVSIFTLLLYIVSKQELDKRGGYVLLFLFISFFLYVRVDSGYILSQFKYWVYLVPLLIAPFICHNKDFNLLLCKACKLTLIFSIFLFILGVGIDNGYGFPRMHGLLSEPSALSFPISVVLLNGVFYKKRTYILLSFVCILLTGSLMTMIITLFSFLMYMFITRGLFVRVLFIGIFVVLLLALLMLINYLAELGTFPTISRLQQGLIFIQSFGASGHNPRFFSVLEVISYINDTNVLFGGGINGAEKYIEVTNNLRDLNLWLEMLLSFGVVGTGAFFIFLLFFVFLNKRKFCYHDAILLSSITVYCTLNSAQGIVFQSLFFIILIQVLTRRSLNGYKDKKFIS
ncbi:MAG: hypothetical protein MJK12_08255 [Colwellia sp.]|nr:hypothetical protein [Colwellia sp.]